MSALYFPAIIEQARKGFSVFFPDLPGCTSAGPTLQEAARSAEEALSGHLLLMSEEGETIPTPTSLDKIEIDPEIKDVARLLVRVEPPGRKVRVNIMIDEGLLAAIDAVASNRSGFIADAARAALTVTKGAA